LLGYMHGNNGKLPTPTALCCPACASGSQS
jgi:hypothetical protein